MAPSTNQRLAATLPFLCYALLIAAWVLDLVTPQLFVAAILLNGPIALSSLALNRRLTTSLVIAAQVANAIAAYVNGASVGYHWDAVAIGDRALSAASFLLVGFLSVKTQEYAREAGVSSTRMQQVEIEKALREATGRVRGTLNVELVLRGMLRESLKLLGADHALLVVRDSAVQAPMLLTLGAASDDVGYDRRALSTELASLVARARDTEGAFRITADDALGRLTLESLEASEALVVAIGGGENVEYTLVECAEQARPFAPDALSVLQSFSEQAGTALEQARLFTQLGEQNDEIARQKDELSHRGDVIRDIVYALAHDLRTPLAAMDVTIKQALAGAYGDLPERYRTILASTLASNEDERRIVETLLLVARYEAGEESNLREPVDIGALVRRVVEDLQPVADAKGVSLQAAVAGDGLGTSGDPSEIRRAIVNLVANAIEATPEGGAVVVRASRSTDSIAVAVEDTGYGVAPERRDALFARFGGTGPGGGTGLGLYIVRRIVEKHGGTVTYEPREPRGSTFTMILPYREE
ncbi:MAG TPA: GAF domain-containing sensor histidine kinase [Candidatus Acidoferrales bacterium]|nr:GAF domain-containing sensor histidine kinase [Candidatus Acidoferrales bacterium]